MTDQEKLPATRKPGPEGDIPEPRPDFLYPKSRSTKDFGTHGGPARREPNSPDAAKPGRKHRG